MKRTIALLLIACAISIGGITQDTFKPKKVSKAAFFDKTIALKDMPVILPKPGDNSWKDDIIENETVNFGKNKNRKSVTDPLSVQQKMGSKNTKGPIVNIDGTGNVNGVYPPDTDGDVGPNHYFQMINLSFAIYDKSGSKLYGPVANSTLWSGFPGPWAGTNDGDPIIMYDELADRWVATQFAIYTSNGKYYELIAVSETGDPLGSWYRYAFEFDDFPDYPKLSVWPDGYYATFHMFSGNFIGMAAVAFEREKMLTGDPDAQMVYFGEYASRFGYLPADVDGVAPPPGTPCYITGVNFWSNQNMEIWKLIPDWNNTSNSTFSLDVSLNTSSFNSTINGIPQPGTGNQLSALNNVLMYRLPFRYFGAHSSMVANHSVRVGAITGIRWYELRDDGNGWEIYQEGTYQPDNEHRWMGSIAMGADGSIAMGYSVSSSSTFPSIRYTGRTPEAPLGEMNIEEVEIVSGGSSQTGIDRWGDYSSLTVDPSSDGVFWFTTEYMKSNGWGTRIASFDFEDIQPPTANAGIDDTICVSSIFETQANAIYYSSLLWETSGDGIFQNPNVIDAKYLRGNGDIANGGFILTLTTYGYQTGWEATDEVYVMIQPESEVFAGNDTTILINDLVQLNGTALNYNSVEWTTNGDGSFNNPNSLDAEYIPGGGDIAGGEVTLSLTAYSLEPCTDSDTDVLTVFITETTAVNNINAQQISVNVIPNPSAGIFTIELKGNTEYDFQVKISNLIGEVIYDTQINVSDPYSQVIDISREGHGIYILEVIGNNFKKVKKIIIE
ncbi:MAG: T9SS type A sorting domain-containing protein [Bacteroidales bacterium]|nr:T9SS type A sorting domain-containing protein [Bacteroidales bacterium]MCF8402897.1 T9SS type A sorting domain-containing protein [Bacteroidales bacterium]